MAEESQEAGLETGSGDNIGRRHYRRLPDISSISAGASGAGGPAKSNQSSRSFDSGICVLLSDSGSPSPPLAGDNDTDTPHHTSSSHLSCQSSSSSPIPPRSPITPSKRASFHAYSPAKLPKPPSSPSFKNSKPSFFSCRRFSEQSKSCDSGSSLSQRTLSPCQHQSPSPSLSSKSSPQLQRSLGAMAASSSLQSTESSDSPPKSPDPCSISPANVHCSPVPLTARRKLPETPPIRPKFASSSSDKNIGSSGTQKPSDMTHNFFKAQAINIESKTLLFCTSFMASLVSLGKNIFRAPNSFMHPNLNTIF